MSAASSGRPASSGLGAVAVARCGDALEGVQHQLAGDGLVDLAVEGHDRAVCGHGIAGQRASVRLTGVVVRGQTHRVALLGDGTGRGGEVGSHAVGRVEIDEVVEGRLRPLDLLCVGQRAGAMRGLAVERSVLLRVLAIGQVALLAQHDAELFGEASTADVVEVGRYLTLVGGHRGEGLGRESLAHIGRDGTVLARISSTSAG